MPETSPEAEDAAIGAEHFSPSMDLGLLPADDSWEPCQVESILTLGKGRAARAMLVRATDAEGNERLCVEKIFAPGLLTRLIYRCVFQSPFAYQASADAILACFYRRRAAAALVRTLIPEAAVAEPLYVRWDAESRAYVLASELIRGRGIRPAAANSRILRETTHKWFRNSAEPPDPTPEEIDELLDLMSRLETLFRESGLVGSGWQVSKAAVVATANLLRVDDGYVIVDLESGIPAMLVPYYLFAGLRIGSLPLFDDNDPQVLLRFLETHRGTLRQHLGDDGFQRLSNDAEKLIEHSLLWKQAEIAVGRRGLPIVSRRFRDAYRRRRFDIWKQNGLIDDTTDEKLRSSSRLLTRPLYWLGFIPTALGRVLQRLHGHRTFRQQFKDAVRNSQVRDELLKAYCERKSRAWQEQGRVQSVRMFSKLSLRFVGNWVLSKTVPAPVHRWLSDSDHRRTSLQRMFLLAVSARFQREFGKYAIRGAIREWDKAGRLQPGELQALQNESSSQNFDEYARCFGMHLSVKLIAPLLIPLKIGGVFAFVLTGDVLCLLPIVVSPACRTAITLWRMARNVGRRVNYGEALLVGVLPVIGNLAYPVQMFASHRQLATFLIRDNAARLGRWLPIYGGRDSRVEIAAVKAANLPLELLEIGLSLTAAIRRLFVRTSKTAPTEQVPVILSASRWDRLIDSQLKLLAETEASHQSVSERIDHLVDEPNRLRAAS